jgi:hypothetical protein
MEVEAKRRAVERRAVERRVVERRVVERRAATRKRVKIAQRPMPEARSVRIVSKCGSWLLNVLVLKKVQKD